MRIAIFTHVEHVIRNQKIFGYGPYIREMNLWGECFDEAEVIAPMSDKELGNIDMSYNLRIIFTEIPAFNLTNMFNAAKALLQLPYNLYIVASAMRRADHIHIRCPGNIGLIACIVQIFFPQRPKTAKYAGNWDSKSKQPWSYRLQKWILNNTFLTRNMTVLVYGSWAGASKNIKPFFTASYSEAQKRKIIPRELRTPIRFLFVGTLSPGKRPLYAIQLIHHLIDSGVNATLDIYGEGIERLNLMDYIERHTLEKCVRLLGNHSADAVTNAYQNSHFLILPSVSEGWPKVVAEAMFWGCVPLSTSISCVPEMLGHGSRGILLTVNLAEDSHQVNGLLGDPQKFNHMAEEAAAWSRQFTTDAFEQEITKLLSNRNDANPTVNR